MTLASLLRISALCLAWLSPSLGQAAEPQVSRQTTPAGLSYLHAALPEAKTESIQLLWRDGTTLASPELAYLGGIAPSLFSDGPKGESRASFGERLQDIRVGYGWGLSNDGLQLGLSFRPRALDDGIDAMATLIANPALDTTRFEELRRNLRLGAAQARESGDAQAGLIAARLAFGKGAMYRLQSRDPAIYEQASYEALTAWRERVLGRDNLIVVAAGALPPAELGPRIDRLLASLPQAAQPTPDAVVPVAMLNKTVILERDVPQTILLAGGVARIRPGLDTQLAAIATQVLHGGSQSRLYKALREKLGATYGVGGGWRAFDRGESVLYSIRSSVDHDRAASAIAALRSEYALWWEQGITADELDEARTRIRQGRAERQRSPSAVASTLASGLARGLPDTMLADAGRSLEAITRDDVNAFIRASMPKPDFGLVIVAPSASRLSAVGLEADCVVKRVEEVDACPF